MGGGPRATLRDMADTPGQDPQKDRQEAEFTRKLVLGVLGTLEHKGLLSKGEVDSILRAARQAAFPAPAPTGIGPAAPGTRWVRADGQPNALDRTTPVAIPDVRRRGEEGAEKPPMIDLTLE